ncbi:MAG: hypothetical protein HZB43_11935 [candidate division Zixibacteria bacterium]|nr:hypothetical protein [candidate division Zixibacteria bacterium]
MSWLRRKNATDDDAAGDPSIEFARRVIQNPRGSRNRKDHDKNGWNSSTPPPNGSDSDFCYGEEINPCA